MSKIDCWLVWTLRGGFLFINNLYIWRLMNMNCYLPKETVLFPLKFTIMSLICNLGLWFASTSLARRYPKMTSIALVPTFLVTPIFVTMDYWSSTLLAILTGTIGLTRCWRGRHEVAAKSYGRS